MIGYYGIKRDKNILGTKLTEIISIPWVLQVTLENGSLAEYSYDVNDLEKYIIKCKKKGKLFFGKGFNYKEIEIPDEYIKDFVDSCFYNKNSNNRIINKRNKIIDYVLNTINDENNNWWKFGKSWNEKWE